MSPVLQALLEIGAWAVEAVFYFSDLELNPLPITATNGDIT
jgi:hypothetical protein